MEWFLKKKDFNILSRNFEQSILENYHNSGDIYQISNRLESLLSEKSFSGMLYTESLWICSQARKYDNNKNIISIVIAFLNQAEIFVEQFKLISNNELYEDLDNLSEDTFGKEQDKQIANSNSNKVLNDFRRQNNSLIDIAINKLRKFIDDVEPCIESCLTQKEINQIEEEIVEFKLEESEEDLYADILTGTQVNIIDKFKNFAQIQKYYNQLFEIYDAARSGKNEFNLALACLSYVVKKNDVISDNIGLLGLVDDFYAIDFTHKNLKSNELQNLIFIHDSKYPSFKIPELVSSGGALSLINLETIIKASYTKKSKEAFLKRVIIVPDVGPLPTLSSLGKSITDRLEQSKINNNPKKFKPGDKLFLGRIKKGLVARKIKIFAEYDGTSEHLGLHWIIPKEGKNFRLTVRKKILDQALLADENSKTTKVKNISYFLKHSNPEMYGWRGIHFKKNISKQPSTGPIYLFSTKVGSKPYLNEKIYGKSIASWMGVREFNKSGAFTDTNYDNQLFPEPNVYLISSRSVAIELINNRLETSIPRSKPSLVIIDSEEFYANPSFVAEIKDKDIDVIVFIESYKENYLELLLNNNFKTISAKPENIISHNMGVVRSPTASFISRSRAPSIDYKIIVIDELTELHKLMKNISELLKDELYFQVYMGLINLANNRLRKQITIPNNQEVQLNLDLIDSILYSLKQHLKFEDEFIEITSFIQEFKEDLARVNRAKFIELFLIENSNSTNVVLTPPNQKKNTQKFLNEICNTLNLKESQLRALRMDEIESDNSFSVDNLLIPVFISKKTMQKLRNRKYAKKHIYFGTLYENKYHEIWLKKERRMFENSFKNIGQFSSFIENNKTETSILHVEGKDIFEELVLNSLNYQEGAHNDSLHIVECKLFILDDNEIYALPLNGKQLRLKGEIASSQNVGRLAEDDVILVASEYSGEDLVENLLQENPEEYKKYKEIESDAKSWKTLLIKYKNENELTYSQLRELLQKVNIKRTLSTIKHWVNDEDTIAPQQRKDTIEGIYKLVGEINPNKSKHCIDSTSKLYQLSNIARNKLTGIINQANHKDNEISLSINNLNIKFEKKVIRGFIETSIQAKKLYKISRLDNFAEVIE